MMHNIVHGIVLIAPRHSCTGKAPMSKTSTKVARIARTSAAKPILIGTCVFCGGKLYDGQPITCCTRGLLGYLQIVLEHAAEQLAAK